MKNLIKVERARYNLSQQDLADILGIRRQTVCAMEKGKYVPSARWVLKIAKLFNVRVEDIFFLDKSDLESLDGHYERLHPQP